MKPTKQTLSILDVLKVKHDQESPESAVKVFEFPDAIRTINCDILIVGGSTAGVAAALSVTANSALHVCLIEETDWLGGQMTAQGVPITDDGKNFLVETSGSNRSYQLLRRAIRSYYKQTYKLSQASLEQRFFNPGNCWYWVSQLAFEPKVAVELIDKLLSNQENPGTAQVYLRYVPVKVECADRQIEQIVTVNLDTGEWLAFQAKCYLDATALGDVVSLSGAAYSSGTESISETGEPHAAETADPEQVQDYTFPFIVEFVPGTDNTIAKPALYDHFNEQGKFSLLAYKMFGHGHKVNADGVIISELMPFWTYRRILDKTAFVDQRIPNDVAVINWFSNDFRGHNIIDKPPLVVSQYLSLAKACSLSFLYWLQTEAPRDEGGKGYPEIRLKIDALGTADGLAKYPYIRESRRGKAFTIVREQDIRSDSSSSARARLFDDSVGLGFFPIDIHGAGIAPGTLNPTRHFQIPLAALLLDYPSNLVLSSKNIGLTHITNAAYRMHPIEWAIGEAAGTLARFSIEQKVSLSDLLKEPNTRLLQLDLIRAGAPLYWYDDVQTTDPHFEAIQFLAVLDIMRGDPKHLHFYPQAKLGEDEARHILRITAAKYKALESEQNPPASADTRGAFAFWLYNQLQQTAFSQSLPTVKRQTESRI